MSAAKTNILLLIMDDQRHDTIAALGNRHIRTPHLDWLVQRGTVCRASFCTIPICTPARAEVLTGRSSFRNGVAWFNRPIDPSLTLLPRHLQQHGYHTVFVGKWHNDGLPRDRGFARTRRVAMNDNLLDYNQHGKEVAFKEGDSIVRGHSNELFADAAIEELAQAPSDRPWFMMLATISPHDPFHSPEPFASMYNPQRLPVPKNFMPEHPFDNGEMVIRDELLEPPPRTPASIQRYLAAYYGLISHHDHHLGRVFERLASSGQLDNTVICFTSDHGLAVGSHGLIGKENLYDHSIRVPLILAGSGIPQGRSVEGLTHHVDLFPTFCDVAGIPIPSSADEGHSLLPLLRGEIGSIRDATFHAFRHPMDYYPGPTAFSADEPGYEESQRAIRTEHHKLTYYPHLRRHQLFDLVQDPHETADLTMSWRHLASAMSRTRSAWTTSPTLRLPSLAEVQRMTNDLRQRLVEKMRACGDPAESLIAQWDTSEGSGFASVHA